MTAAGGRSNGVRPSLSSASLTLRSYGPPAPEPTRLHGPDTCGGHQLEPRREPWPHLHPGVRSAGADVLLLPTASREGTVKLVPLLAARRDLTAGRPVCVLTDLSPRLEEQYATLPKMSRLRSLDFLSAGHQEVAVDARQFPPVGKRRDPADAAVSDSARPADAPATGASAPSEVDWCGRQRSRMRFAATAAPSGRMVAAVAAARDRVSGDRACPRAAARDSTVGDGPEWAAPMPRAATRAAKYG